MGILKKTTPAPAAFEAEDNGDDTAVLESGAGEQGGEVVGEAAAAEPAAVVKTVTRAQAPKVTPAPKDAETAAPAAKDAEKIVPAVKEAELVAKDAEAGEPAADASKTSVLALNSNGQLKTFLNSGNNAISPLANLRDAFTKAGIETDYSTFPRMRVDAGCIASPEGAEAGDYLEVQVVSFSPSWTVTTGVDGEEGKKWVRFSDDGKVTNPAGDKDEFAGWEVEAYKQHLVDQGFEKASIKNYLVVYGLALEAQEADFKHLNELVAVSLAPQSRKKFDSYLINRAIQARMGRHKETSSNPVVRFTVERVKGKDVSYFNLIPSHGVSEPVNLTGE